LSHGSFTTHISHTNNNQNDGIYTCGIFNAYTGTKLQLLNLNVNME